MSEIHRHGIDMRELDTILAEDVSFEGEIEFSKPLMIKGRLEGTVSTTSDFIVSEGAVVEAQVSGRYIDIRGRLSGNVIATDRVDLAPSAFVKGDLVAPQVFIEAGARFNGRCTMEESK